MFKCTSKPWLRCICLMFDIMHRGCFSELAECIESFRSCETSIVGLRLKSVGRTSKRHFVQVQLLRLSNYSQTRQHTRCVGREICMFDIHCTVRWFVATVLSYVLNLVFTLGPGFEFTSAHMASLVKLKLAVEFE